MRRSRTAALLVLVLATSGCASSAGTGIPRVDPSASSDPGAPVLPSGWRWESYGGVQVGVPGEWGWGNASQRLGQWCVARNAANSAPVVGRSGLSTLVACPHEGDPPPETLVAHTGVVVGLARTTAGCDHNGFDDGVSVRSLTPGAVAPFMVGPHEELEVSGGPAVMSSMKPWPAPS